MSSVELPARSIPVLASADVVVAGGGPAGLAAALSAARQGASVLLTERFGFLGGNMTAASVGTICGLYVNTGSGFDFAVEGLAREIADNLMAAGQGIGPVPFKETAVFLYVPWAAKRLADSLVSGEDEIKLLLHSQVCDVAVAGERIEALVLASKRGQIAVTGDVFVDATGDADVAWLAGAPTAMGPSGARQFASMQFFIEHADTAEAIGGLAALPDAIAESGAHLSRDSGALIPTRRPGEFIGAMTRVTRDGAPLDPTDPEDVTFGELEGRRLAEEAFDFVRANMDGFSESFLADTPPMLGVRESRHIEGDFALSGADVRGGAIHHDDVAACAWPEEYHVSGRSTEYVFQPPGRVYGIPYRCLLPRGVANLLVAGRCISAEHEALASTRVMAPCMALGQAAGTAAAMAVSEGVEPSAVDTAGLRERLLAAGARLPEGRAGDDDHDREASGET